MLNINSFIKQSSIYTLSSFLSRGISLLLIPLYTRVLSPEDYGAVDILTLSCTLINMIIALEIHQAIARFYNDWKPGERRNYISTAFIFTNIVYLLFTSLAISFRSYLASFFLNDSSKTDIIVSAIIMAWASGVYYFAQSQLRWQLKTHKHAVTTVVFTITSALISILLLLVFDLGVLGVLWGLIAGNLVGTILSLYFARDSYFFFFNVGKLVEMLNFSSPLVLSSISVFFSLYIDRILIKEMLSLEDLGLFSIGYRFASIVSLLLVGVNNAITPLIYTHHSDPSTPGQMEKVFRVFVIGALILFVGISLLSGELLTIFTTEAYLGAEQVIPFLILTTLLASLYNFTPGLYLANKTKVIALINVVVAGTNLLLNLLLIPMFGLIGSCLATLVGYIINFVIYYYYNQKYYPLNFSWLRCSSALLVAIVFIWGIRFLPSMGFGALVFIKVGVIMAFAGACVYILADASFVQMLRSKIGLSA